MSIINEALRKTQQIRKQNNEKREVKETVAVEPIPVQPVAIEPIVIQEDSVFDVQMQKSVKVAEKLNWLFSTKMAGYLVVSGLLVIMSYMSYQHARNEKQPIEMAAAKPAKRELAFSGIFVSDNSRIAIINKQSYHAGDMVSGMKIVTIHQDSVDLQQNNKLIKLRAGATYLL